MSRVPGRDWFGTADVQARLRTRTVRSGAVAIAGRAAHIGIQIGTVMVLARILTPSDFGIVAMVVPLTILVAGITNLALQSAVIHEDDLDPAAATRLFWFAARVNLLPVLMMAAAAPVLARLYGEPRVTAVAIAWAAIVWISTLGAVHEALLKRQMRFHTVAAVNGAALFGAALVALAAAWLGAGYWSLVLQIAALELGRAAGVWLACDWRPGRPTREAHETSARLRTYWGRVAGFRVVTWLGDHPDRILVAWVGGAPVLGLYDTARRWAWYPFIELFLSLSDVAVASLSRLRRDPDRYRAFATRGITAVLSAALPAVAFIFVEARSFVLVLLGDQWLAAVPFVRLMAVAAFAGAGARLTQWLYLSSGRTGRLLRWAALVNTPVMLLAVGIGALQGVMAIAAGFTAATAALTLPAIVFALAGSPVRFSDYAGALGRPMLASAAGAALLFVLGGMVADTSPVLRLGLGLAIFLPVYASAWIALPGGRAALVALFQAAREIRPRPASPLPAATMRP